MNGKTFRSIPTTRVKDFIEAYVAANYPEGAQEGENGYSLFSFDSGIAERTIWSFRSEKRPNVMFDVVDRMLTNLGCLHVWHLPKEEGGFADYYTPDIPPAPVEPTLEQSRYMSDDSAASRSRRTGLDVMDVLHARAEVEMAYERDRDVPVLVTV